MPKYIVKTHGGRPYIGSRPSVKKGSINFGPIVEVDKKIFPPWFFVN